MLAKIAQSQERYFRFCKRTLKDLTIYTVHLYTIMFSMVQRNQNLKHTLLYMYSITACTWTSLHTWIFDFLDQWRRFLRQAECSGRGNARKALCLAIATKNLSVTIIIIIRTITMTMMIMTMTRKYKTKEQLYNTKSSTQTVGDGNKVVLHCESVNEPKWSVQ